MYRLLLKSRQIVAALLIAVLVGLPVFDVLTCGFEDTAVHATSDASADSHHEGDDSNQQHGTCAHNHCHHAGASILQEMAMPSTQVKRLLPVGGIETLYPISILDGPMRPPQA
jgi:hypothetical protein